MIDVTKEIQKTIKKQIWNNDNQINIAARNVLAELKTKLFDFVNINNDIQYKILKKMLKARLESMEIYISKSLDLYSKERNESEIIKKYINQIQKELPKQLTENQILTILKEQKFSNIANCMKWFSEKYPQQDKKQISILFRKIETK